MNNNLFATATRKKLRFPIGGSISVEDVWDLPLKARANRPTEPSLNELAVILNDHVEALPRRSFVDDEDETQAADPHDVVLKLEIVKTIIAVKKAEAKAKEGAAVKAGQVSELDALIARKRQAEMENLSLEELEARRKALLNGEAG